MKQRIPPNVHFMFAGEGCSPEVYETAKSIVADIDSIYEPDIDRAAPNGSAEILYHTPKSYLSVTVSQNAQIVEYRGSNVDGTIVIEGKNPATCDMSFLGTWLDQR